MAAKLIVFEGPDQVGKGTQSRLFEKSLRKSGHRVVRVEVPIHSPITHKMIYWMLSNGTARQFPNSFQFVHFINKLMFQALKLPKLMAENDVVILDRWTLSAVVYGDATGVHPDRNVLLYNTLKKPDATVVIVGPTRSRGADDAYEASHEIQDRVRHSYTMWADDHENDHVLVDFDDTPANIHDFIVAELSDFLDF